MERFLAYENVKKDCNLKASKYNFFYPYKKSSNEYIAYNSLTSSLAIMGEENYQQYLDFCNKGIPIQDNKFFEDLKKGGFILDKRIDELDIIRHDMYNNKFNTNNLILTIAPTLDCNFSCEYCFEKKVINKPKMTEETADQIINFIKQKSELLESLNIVWYGGEPLLEINMIKYLSNEIIKICNEHNIKYIASMVTNGYCLNEEIIKILQESRVSTIQITVDGGEKTHNKRRFLENGDPTFNRIINNLLLLKQYNYIAYLRINIDKMNKKEAFNVIDILVGLGLEKVIIPCLGIIKNYNDCYKDDKCISSNEYLEVIEEFDNYIMERGFMSTRNNVKLPPRINYFCTAEKMNSLVINADGEVYKCWNDIGIYKRSVGNIREELLKNNTYLKYVMSDPTKDKQCSNCKYLPICFSGCPLDRKNKNGMRCLEIKSDLKDRLHSVIESAHKSF